MFYTEKGESMVKHRFSVRECEIGLNMIRNIGAKRMKTLLEFFGDASEVLGRGAKVYKDLPGIGEAIRRDLSGFDFAELEKELKVMEKEGIRTLHLEDEGYPVQLRSLPDPPPVLYVQGSLEADEFCLGIVGTRSPSQYGRMVTEKLAGEISRAGITVVSGLARGVDTIAHRAALQCNGRTIAVLGSGLKHLYPPENRSLAGRIAETGALISEQPLFRKPDRYNFPARNRIISGLSSGVLVTEAPVKSGSLITAEFALEQGREVFAVPSPITSDRGKGCNYLLRNGATMVEEIGDIVECFPELEASLIRGLNIENIRTTKAEQPLSEQERAILHHLSETPVHIDTIAGKTKLSSQVVSAFLMQLEMLEKVKNTGGGFYIRSF